MPASSFAKSALVVTAALAIMPVSFAWAIDKSEYNTTKSRIEADYKADHEACKALKHNEKDVCDEQAKGKEKVAKAELEFNYSGKEADRVKLMEAKADASYAVAKEQCDDKAGNDKSVCVKEAKAAHTTAMADAKASKKITEARSDAADDKRDANYKVAVQKCDALAGTAKDNCIAAAKAQYGKS